MSATTARFDPREVGYRRPLLALGVAWSGLTALRPFSTSPDLLLGVSTAVFALAYTLDGRALEPYDAAVRHPWAYAFLVPTSWAAWTHFAPVLTATVGSPTVVAFLGLFVGAPASVLVYCWQRGRRVA
ncbi:hypothetical protein DMJ13_02360 [halophilic archaeon]|nr:hypothetical protein DMJ13_02360 [halophilic archaeon]